MLKSWKKQLIGISFSKNSKKLWLHINKDNYKQARNEVQKLIRSKKKPYNESKLTGNIGKPKELWKCLKS